MSNELSISASLSFSKGGASVNRADGIQVDVTGDAFTHQVQLIGEASEEALVEGTEVGTPGYVFIKNLDDTNSVSVGITGSYTIELLPGQFALFPAAAAIFAKAITADCNVEYIIIEI